MLVFRHKLPRMANVYGASTARRHMLGTVQAASFNHLKLYEVDTVIPILGMRNLWRREISHEITDF